MRFIPGDAHELQTLADRLTGAYAWTYWGAIISNFLPLQALWWRSVRRTGLVADVDLDCEFAVGMWLEPLHDPGHKPLPRLPGFRRGASSRLHSGTGRPYFGTIGLFLVPFLIAIRVRPAESPFLRRRNSFTKSRRRRMPERGLRIARRIR